MKLWDNINFHKEAIGLDRRFKYVPFHKLSTEDQKFVRAAYVYKSVGGKYDFIDEHYFYPVNKAGKVSRKARASRELAIPKAKLDDDNYMKSLGYEINPEWLETHEKKASRKIKRGNKMRKELQNRLVRVAKALEKLGADDHLIVYDYEQFDELTDEQKKAWKGYHYKMTYGVVSEESAQEGDYADHGWIEEGSDAYESLEDVLQEVSGYSWVEWSSSQPGPHDWLTSEASQEDLSFGDYTNYDLWIYRGDGQPLSKDEMVFISKSLGVNIRM